MIMEKKTGNIKCSGKWLFDQNIVFTLGVTRLEDLPTGSLPEIAFFGRSNVGKSSLLNAITKKNKLAYTSKNPGRTRELNFFSISNNSKALINIVDMPGYGYAKAPKKEMGMPKATHIASDGRKNRERTKNTSTKPIN